MLTKEAKEFAELGASWRKAMQSVEFARLTRAYDREYKRDNHGRFAKVNVASSIKSGAKRFTQKGIPEYDYKPSEAIKKMMASKRTSLEKLDEAVAAELVTKNRKSAIALVERERDSDTPVRGSKDYREIVDDVAYELAAKSYEKEFSKISNATDKDGWIHLPNKTSIQVNEGALVNEFEVENEDGEITERGFFFTKKELDGVVKKHN
jgi:hypothetical protein